jgi:hypothetical protein
MHYIFLVVSVVAAAVESVFFTVVSVEGLIVSVAALAAESTGLAAVESPLLLQADRPPAMTRIANNFFMKMLLNFNCAQI